MTPRRKLPRRALPPGGELPVDYEFQEWDPAVSAPSLCHWPVVRASGGHAFLLFTSLRAMRDSAHWGWAADLARYLRFQLNDGEQLYASNFPGNFACIASANFCASARSGVEVSHHSMSA